MKIIRISMLETHTNCNGKKVQNIFYFIYIKISL